MKYLFLALSAVLFLVSCQTSKVIQVEQRTPQSVDKNQFRKSNILTSLAKNKIFFIAEDNLYKEKPTEDAGKQCVRIDDPIWTKIIDETLNAVEKSESTLSHIHAIRISAGGASSVNIVNEDGYSILEISYLKKTTFSRMESILDVPCSADQSKYISQQRTVKSYQWPSENEIKAVLSSSSPRDENIDWLKSSEFLQYLAKQQILFVINNGKFQTRTQKNSKIIVDSMDQLNQEVLPKTSFKNFEKLNIEISKKSEQGTIYRVLTIKSDMMSQGGIFVDATSTISRRINQTQTSGMTLFYLVLNNRHDFKLSGISELNECLSDFMTEKEDIELFSKKYDQSGEAFLYPGYKCP